MVLIESEKPLMLAQIVYRILYCGPQPILFMEQFFKLIFILPIRFYKRFVSPLFPPSCRYQPTCSTYMIEAIEEWGIAKGLWLGTKRFFSCHPWSDGGYDPVPKKKLSRQEKKAKKRGNKHSI